MRAVIAAAVALVVGGGVAWGQQEVSPGTGIYCCYSPIGNSNETTLKNEETLAIMKYTAAPLRGDVVVFKLPRNPSKSWVKRLIGLPGDRIQLKDARLYINDEEVPREETTKFKTRDQFGQDVEAPTYIETLPGGVKHRIIQLNGDNGFYSNTPVYTVPPDNYFMMGDNRDNSTDSRVSPDQDGVGYVPFKNFLGRVLS